MYHLDLVNFLCSVCLRGLDLHAPGVEYGLRDRVIVHGH